MARLFVPAVSALLLCGVGSAPAQADERRKVQQEIQETEKSIAAGKAQQRSLSGQARTIRDQVDGLRIRAAIAAHEAQKEEAVLSAVEERLAVLRRQDADYRGRLAQMRESMTRSIAALIRMERQPAAALLAAPGTMLDAARGGRLLAAALPALYADADELGALLAAAGQVRGELTREQRQRASIIAALSGRRQELEDLLQEQAKSERQLRRAGASEGKRLVALAGKAKDLRALMQRLDVEEQRRQRRQRQVAALEAARIAAQEADQNSANKAARDAARKSASLAERRRRKFAADMARALATPKAGKGAGEKDRGASAPAQRLAMGPSRVPFSKIRGRLRLPAKGKQVGNFGDSTGFGPRAQGITLRTRNGAQVVVPYDGRVVFAGPFRDYGLILIISHGEGYHTLLAGLSTLQAVVGQSLLTGEPVGRMGGDDKRSLYIEIRRKGVAINPNPWWSSSRERASG